ncbi:hypothetical protein TYRP_008746 [Tyrophagus putrescentiae]|nr:hypothetical protein TYRP_008746 [Tyrophagus putrescentiae]
MHFSAVKRAELRIISAAYERFTWSIVSHGTQPTLTRIRIGCCLLPLLLSLISRSSRPESSSSWLYASTRRLSVITKGSTSCAPMFELELLKKPPPDSGCLLEVEDSFRRGRRKMKMGSDLESK